MAAASTRRRAPARVPAAARMGAWCSRATRHRSAVSDERRPVGDSSLGREECPARVDRHRRPERSAVSALDA
jgi:hypothetical protein